MRDADYSDRYQGYFTLGSDISTRDRDAIHKTFSGLMKLLYPHGEATVSEIKEILLFAVEGRKRVKDQILRIDPTMAEVRFGYLDAEGTWHGVATLEEEEYPGYYHHRQGSDGGAVEPSLVETPSEIEETLFEGYKEFQENQRGISYNSLLLPYLRGASEITIVDSYVRHFHRVRNLMELVEMLAINKDPADPVKVRLVTTESTEGVEKAKRQLEMLLQVQESAATAGIALDVKFDPTLHD